MLQVKSIQNFITLTSYAVENTKYIYTEKYINKTKKIITWMKPRHTAMIPTMEWANELASCKTKKKHKTTLMICIKNN